MPRRNVVQPLRDPNYIYGAAKHYRQPNARLDWYVGSNYYLYPNLFLSGYEHFQRTINVHNRRWPTDKWPMLTLREFLDRAKWIQQRRYASKHPNNEAIRFTIATRHQQAKHRANTLFWNYVKSHYGGIPTNKPLASVRAEYDRYVDKRILMKLNKKYK